ncbi:unnamed protein product [Soboliphyme baturini]|uniref:Secreted protein n=1 Tax=Soboliphyme baturini TaxID=241478 RepID=A0A183IDR0_9BILA|nr:unnamed protein product [Soboliphyme baturini]
MPTRRWTASWLGLLASIASIVRSFVHVQFLAHESFELANSQWLMTQWSGSATGSNCLTPNAASLLVITQSRWDDKRGGRVMMSDSPSDVTKALWCL